MILNSYIERNAAQERKLYEVIQFIQTHPGIILGSKSLTGLFHFLGGYEVAYSDLTGYRFHFNKEFQAFISGKYPTNKAFNWCSILLQNRSEEAAFEQFYEEFDRFLKLREAREQSRL